MLSAAQAPAQQTLPLSCINAIYRARIARRSSRLPTGLEVRQLVNLAVPPSIDGYAIPYSKWRQGQVRRCRRALGSGHVSQ